MSAVIDDFNRADGALGTSTSGHNWSNFGGGTLVIASNRAAVTAAAAFTGARIGGDADLADAITQVTLPTIGTVAAGLVFRWSDDGNFWCLQAVGNSIYTRRFQAFVNDLDYVNNIGAHVDGDVWAVEHVGNDITVRRNAGVVRTFSDPFNATATRGGLLARPSAEYDNFSITPVSGGGGLPAGVVNRYRRDHLRMRIDS